MGGATCGRGGYYCNCVVCVPVDGCPLVGMFSCGWLWLVCVCMCVHSTFLPQGKSIWRLFIEQFDDLLVKILLGAAIISFVSLGWWCVSGQTGKHGQWGHRET